MHTMSQKRNSEEAMITPDFIDKPEDMINQIVLGDCLETMRRMPDNYIDLVLTDPPYDLELHGGGINGFSTRKLAKEKHIEFLSNSFDIGTVFSEFERICNPLNAVVFCSNKQISKIMHWWEQRNYSVTLLVWDKPNPVPFGNGKYLPNLEFIVFVRGKKVTYKGNNTKTFRVNGVSSKKRLHPTEKPLELIKSLLNIHSNSGDVVYDPFMGSGTTAKAAKYLGRNYIGSEISKEYCEIAENRLKQETLL